MYRIELSPGEETVFRTIEELAIGVRNGVISPRARIYHHASEKWLPIEFHPHYKKAIESLTSKNAPSAMAHPVPVGAGSAPLPAPILAPLSTPTHTPRPSPVPAPRPSPMPWEVIKAPAPPVESPVHHLLKLAYPEVTPTEAPVAHASRARARSGTRRPVQLAVVASVILGCTFIVMRASARPDAPDASDAPETVVAPRPEAISSSRPAPAPVDRPRATAPRATAPRATAPRATATRAPAPAHSSTAATRSTAAMTSAPGPAFAPATIGPKPAVVKPPVVAPGKSAGAPDSTPAIEPAPAAVDLSLPALPQGDSLSVLPKSTTDSNAIGRILRAVGGIRPAQKPAP
jgi:hypothetical protein